jgi:hypothetical protein
VGAITAGDRTRTVDVSLLLPHGSVDAPVAAASGRPAQVVGVVPGSLRAVVALDQSGRTLLVVADVDHATSPVGFSDRLVPVADEPLLIARTSGARACSPRRHASNSTTARGPCGRRPPRAFASRPVTSSSC